MRLKDKIQNDIERLEPSLLPMVHDYIQLLKHGKPPVMHEKVSSSITQKQVQEMLSSSKKNWADDIALEREERI